MLKCKSFWKKGNWDGSLQETLRDLTQIINNLHEDVESEEVAELLHLLGDYMAARSKLEKAGFYNGLEMYPLIGYIGAGEDDGE